MARGLGKSSRVGSLVSPEAPLDVKAFVPSLLTAAKFLVGSNVEVFLLAERPRKGSLTGLGSIERVGDGFLNLEVSLMALPDVSLLSWKSRRRSLPFRGREVRRSGTQGCSIVKNA